MIFIFECTLPVDIFNTILSNEYTANNLVSFYIYSNNHSSHSAKQSYQTILRKRCSPLYIYSGTKIKQDDHRSKYPSIFPGSSILLFSSVPSSHCIIESYRDRQRKKKIRIFRHSRLFRSAISTTMEGSFQPRSSGGKIQFFRSPRLFILTLKGSYRTDIYTDQLVVCTVYLHRLFPPRFTPWIDSIAVSIPSSNLFPCVSYCALLARNAWTLNRYRFKGIYIVDIFQNLYE